MIDIKPPEQERKRFDSRAEILGKRYTKVNGVDYETLMALRDISVTLAMILDEMRGVKND